MNFQSALLVWGMNMVYIFLKADMVPACQSATFPFLWPHLSEQSTVPGLENTVFYYNRLPLEGYVIECTDRTFYCFTLDNTVGTCLSL